MVCSIYTYAHLSVRRICHLVSNMLHNDLRTIARYQFLDSISIERTLCNLERTIRGIRLKKAL